jgi:hypothetical protein
MSPHRVGAAVALLVLAVAGCSSDEHAPAAVASTTVPAATAPTSVAFSTAVISRDGSDDYTVQPAAHSAAITADAGNVGGNLRIAFWNADSPDLTDSYACATWRSASADDLQQGIGLRIRAGSAGTRLIMITKNVYLRGFWVFNIDVWDTAASGLSVVQSFDLQSVFRPAGVLVPLPWHMCARVNRDVVDFKAWPDTVPTPAWGDPAFGGSTRLPPGWTYPGKAGWYIGHVPPGGAAAYTDLDTGRTRPRF